MIEQTIVQLKQLKLSAMANALISQIEQPGTYQGLSFEERLQLLTDSVGCVWRKPHRLRSHRITVCRCSP